MQQSGISRGITICVNWRNGTVTEDTTGFVTVEMYKRKRVVTVYTEKKGI
jgi:hypothetical protein